MAIFLDILLLALIVATIGNLISNFKGKKDNLFGKAAFPLLMLLIPAFYGTLVTQEPEPPEQSPETIYKTSTKSIGVAALKKAQSESKMLKSQEQSIDKVSSAFRNQWMLHQKKRNGNHRSKPLNRLPLRPQLQKKKQADRPLFLNRLPQAIRTRQAPIRSSRTSRLKSSAISTQKSTIRLIKPDTG